MKTLILFGTMLLSTICSFGQFVNYGNTAINYCKTLGYELKEDKETQETLVLLPDGKLVSPWKFLRGEVGQEYSYCAKKGYKIRTKYIETHGGHWAVPICDSKEKGNKSLMELLSKDDDYSSLFVNIPKDDLPTDTIFDKKLKVPVCCGPGTPQSFDWNDHNGDDFDEAPENQGDYGICYAVAAANVAESVYNHEMETPVGDGFVSLSSAFLAFFGQFISYNDPYLFWAIRGNYGLLPGYEYVPSERLCINGTVSSDDFPWDPDFTSSSDTIFSNWGSQRYRFKTYSHVTASISAIKNALTSKGPLWATMIYSSNDHLYYDGGILTGSGGSSGNHAVEIVGWDYDATASCEFWIVKNSYGISWDGWELKPGYMRVSTMDGRSINQNVYYVEYETPSVSGGDLAYETQTIGNLQDGISSVYYRPDPYTLFDGYSSSDQWTQGTSTSLSPLGTPYGHASVIFRCNYSNGGQYSYMDHDTLDYYNKLVWAGKPVNLDVSGTSTVDCYTYYWYYGYAASDSGLYTYDDSDWGLSNGLDEYVSYSTPPRIYLRATNAGYHTLKFYAINDDGIDSLSYSIYCPTCYQYRAVIYPNPVSSELNIEIEESGNVQASDFELDLLDTKSTKWKSKKSTEKTIVLSVTDIPDGTYILKITAKLDGIKLKVSEHTIVVLK